MSRDVFYKRLGRPVGELSLARREQDVLHDKKWKLFLRRASMFRHIPFVDFVLAAGSMALGNVNEDSDFDVIVGAKHGRIFTARFLCVLAFGALMTRRKKLTHHEHARDKICLNHFVTEKSFALSPPHNIYWEELYKNLVPLMGSEERIRAFFAANSWATPPKAPQLDLRFRPRQSLLKKFGAWALSGALGDMLEARLRRYQLARIKRGLPTEGGRVHYGDDELEFHPDTARIDELTA